MKFDAYSILIVISVLVVLSYVFNYLASRLRIPAVLLLIISGIGLNFAASYLGFNVPHTRILLEILGITGLIFIVLEAALDLSVERKKLPLIARAFASAIAILSLTSVSIALLFSYHYQTDFTQAFIHAIPLSVISSAIAIPSVQNLDDEKKEFVVYESTFSDILGIILFNFVVTNENPTIFSVVHFGWDLILIAIVSFGSTVTLIFLLNYSTSHIRFFLTFAILILSYSLAKFLHLPSLLLILCFGLVLNNISKFNIPLVRRFLSRDKLFEVTREMKMMTAETAFIIRTFFFLLFGYSLHVEVLANIEVLGMGLAVIAITMVLRFVFLNVFLKIKSTPLALIAPRGLITVLLYYSIPESQRIANFGEGVLFMVIVLTSLAMTVGLLANRQDPNKIKEII